MLATLTDQLPTEGKWIYEPKLDGVRALIYVTGGTVRIYSRMSGWHRSIASPLPSQEGPFPEGIFSG